MISATAAHTAEALRRPVVVVCLAAAVNLVPLLDVLVGPGWYVAGVMVIGAGVSGYALGALTPPRVAAWGVVVSVALLTLANQFDSDRYHWLDDVAFFLVVVGGPAMAGAAVAARARQARELTQLSTDLEAQRRADLETARLEEQNRVQEQVHRQISQRVGAIALRAEGAQLSPSARDARAALAEVESVARGALEQLREALGSLHEPPPRADERSDREPWDRPSVSGLDILIALACGAAIAVETLLVDRTEGPGWANVLAALVVAMPLLWRRSRPILVTAAVGALGAAMSLWLTPLAVLVTPLGLALCTAYAIGAWSRAWWWVPGLLVHWGAMFAIAVASGDLGGDLGGAVPVLAFSTSGVALGRIAAGWQARVHQIAASVDALERGRGADVREAVARERQSMASSLHDSVAHAMTVVCVQAGAGQRVGDPADVREALRTIAATARASLTELRTGLGRLDGSHGPLDRVGIAGLARDIGVPVEVCVPGELELRGPGATLVYRVLREALVNVARHAPGARATVTVDLAGGSVRLEVRDDGAPSATFAGGTGTGLSGLSSEVRAGGGHMTWAQPPDGGFEVSAVVPLSAGAQPPQPLGMTR